MAADPKIRYDIEAAVKGGDDVDTLAGRLRELGDVLEGDLQQSAQAAARELQELGTKQRALETFTALKRETTDLSAQLQQTAAVVDRLGPELQQAGASSAQFAERERQASAALADAQASLRRKQDTLRALRAETDAAARKTDEWRGTERALKDVVAAATVEVKTRRSELRSAQQATTQAGAAERALAAEYQRSVKSAAQLSAELGAKNRAMTAARETLQATGVGTRNLAQSQQALQAAVAGVRERVVALAPAYQQAAQAATAGARAQASAHATMRDSLGQIGDQLRRVQQIAMAALGGSYLGGMARNVADTADEFKNLQARVKLATGEGEGFRAAWAGVTRTALETNSALDETGTLFARLHKAAQEGGASAELAQQQALELTRTINQAAQLSGGSADSAKAAVTQLIQGLQSGVLRGEEFNSVMEQAPRLAQAMAAGLGVTTGALRAQANAGQLTTETVMRALRDQAAVVEQEFRALPSTVGRALQNLSTQWTLYVGSSDAGLLSSANAAKALNLLAENLDLVVSSLTAVGKVWAASRIAGLAADFGALVMRTLSASTALEANTAAAAANTSAQVALATAHTRVAAAQAASTAAIATNTTANAAAAARNASAWAAVATFTGQAGRATEAAAAAARTAGAAAAESAGGVGLLGRAFAGVSGLLGGPLGLAITTAMFGGEIKRAIVNVTEWAASFTSAGTQLRRFEEQERAAADAARAMATERRAAAEANRAFEERALGLDAASRKLVSTYDQLTRSGSDAATALAKVAKEFKFDDLGGIRSAVTMLAALEAQGKATGLQLRAALTDAFKNADLRVFETQARAALAGTANEAGKLRLVLDAIADESLRRAGTSARELQTGFSAAMSSAMNDTDALARTLGELGVSGERAGQLLAAALNRELEVATTVAAVERVIERLEAMGEAGEISGERLRGGLEAAHAKLDELRDGVNSTAEALRVLGIQSQETLERTANNAAQAWEQVRVDATVAARTKLEALLKSQADLQKVGKSLPDFEVQRRTLEDQVRIAGGAAGSRASPPGAPATRGGLVSGGMAPPLRREIASGVADGLRAATGVPRPGEARAPSLSTIARGAPGQVDLSYLFDVVERARRNERFGADELPALRALLQAQKFNTQALYSGTMGASMDAYIQQNSFNTLVQKAVNSAQFALQQQGGGATTARTVNVNLNFAGGGRVQVSAKSQADADLLVRELERAYRAIGA